MFHVHSRNIHYKGTSLLPVTGCGRGRCSPLWKPSWEFTQLAHASKCTLKTYLSLSTVVFLTVRLCTLIFLNCETLSISLFCITLAWVTDISHAIQQIKYQLHKFIRLESLILNTRNIYRYILNHVSAFKVLMLKTL